MSGAAAKPTPTLSVVVPVFNEQDNVAPLLQRLTSALARGDETWEILFVDDGSTDDTAAHIRALAVDARHVRLLRLTRNFGHQAALVAGLAHARGRAVVTMDGDLQHPPELLPGLLGRWRAGYEIVQTIRREPADANRLKRAGSRWFYRVLSLLTHYSVRSGATDFRLMNREAVAAFLACGERCRFNRGLVQWIGFRYTEVEYDAGPRVAGQSKYSLRAMLRLAGDAIFSFSWWPLRLAGLAGALITVPAGAYLIYVVYVRLFTAGVVPGWSSILATLLILGGMNLMVLWILGEYVGRMYEEVKRRPLYIVRNEEPLHAQPDDPPAQTAGAADRVSVHPEQE